MTPQQQFNAKVQALIAQSRSLPPATQKAVKEMLDEALKRILGELATIDPARFQAAQLQQLKMSIEHVMGRAGTDMARTVNRLQAVAARNGSEIVTGALGDLPLGHIAADRVKIAQAYTADLITALSRKTAADLNGVIQRAFLGGRQMKDIMADVTAIVGSERAPVIATTELLRVQSIATQASLEDARERHPDLKKQWQHINAARVPRLTHIAADGQVREIDEAFDVDGEQLMYPRDPAASAYNTINCHCVEKPFFDVEDLKSKPAHKRLLDKLGITVEVQAA